MPDGSAHRLPQDLRQGITGLEQLGFDVQQTPINRQRIEREFVRGGGLAGREFVQSQATLQRQFQDIQSQRAIQNALAQSAARGISPGTGLGQAITEQPITQAVTQREQARVQEEAAPEAFEDRERLRLLQVEANRSLIDTQKEFVRQSRQLGRQVQKRTQDLDFKLADQLRTMQTAQRRRLNKFALGVNERLLGGKTAGSIAGSLIGGAIGALGFFAGIGAITTPLGLSIGGAIGGAAGTASGAQQAEAFLNSSRRF